MTTPILGTMLVGGRAPRPVATEWQPSTFASSTSGGRAQSKSWMQQLEGIMDEEDELAMFRTRGAVQGSAPYDMTGSGKSALGPQTASSAHVNLFEQSIPHEMIVPTSDSYGKQILMNHGWRMGAPLSFTRRKYANHESEADIEKEYSDVLRDIWDENAIARTTHARKNRWGLGYSHASLMETLEGEGGAVSAWQKQRVEKQRQQSLFRKALGDIGPDDADASISGHKRKRIGLTSEIALMDDEDYTTFEGETPMGDRHRNLLINDLKQDKDSLLALEDAGRREGALSFRPATKWVSTARVRTVLQVPENFVARHVFPSDEQASATKQDPAATKPDAPEMEKKPDAQSRTAAPDPTPPTADWAASRFVPADSAPSKEESGAAKGPEPRLALKLKRTIAPWVPDPVLLKRCNVADPFTKAQRNDMAPKGEVAGQAGSSRFTMSLASDSAAGAAGKRWMEPITDNHKLPADLAPLTKPKPPASLFSAIFAV